MLKKNKNIKEFAVSTLILSSGKIILLCSTVITSSLLARGLGVENRGIFALVLLLPYMVQSFIGLSLISGVTHYTARYSKKAFSIFYTSWYLNLVLCILQILFTFVIIYYFSNIIIPNTPLTPVYLMTMCIAIPNIVKGISDGILMGLQKYKLLLFIDIEYAILLPFFYIFLYFFKIFNIYSVIISLGLVELIKSSTLLIITIINTYHIKTPKFKITFWTLRLIKYSLWCHISNIMTFLNYKIDVFFVNFFCGKIETGLYSSATSLSEKLWYASQATSQVLFNKRSKCVHQNKYLFSIYVASLTLLITGLASALLWFASPLLITILFGHDYIKTTIALRWLLPGITTMAGARVLANDISASGHPHINSYIAAIVLISNIVLNFLLIPQLGGLKGASLSTSLSYTLQLIILIIVFYYIRIKGYSKQFNKQ